MLLEQITNNYAEDDDDQMQEPTPKGMVRTEMGRLVTKAKAAADEKEFVDAMNNQLKNRVKDAAKYRAMMKLKSMKKNK
jgi:hypothetical protein